MIRRVDDGFGVSTGHRDLPDPVSCRVFADFVDRDCVTTAMHVECHLPTLEDRHLFRIEKVPLVCAGVAGATNDAVCRRAPSPGIATRGGNTPKPTVAFGVAG